MVRCTFSIPFERIKDYTRELSELSSLPEYITAKRGPYIKEVAGATSKIIITYDFEKSRTVEVWQTISRKLDRFRGTPGFALSAQILGKTKEVKRYPLSLKGQGFES